MGAGLNRIENTLALPVRAAGTVTTASADLLKTLATAPKDFFEISAKTTEDIKNVLLGAWNNGKWYHKALNIPLSPIIATGTALEGAVRAVVQPIVGGVKNTWNTGINVFKNSFRSIGRVFSKKPISDFSFEHMKTSPQKLNNYFAKLQAGRGKESSSKNSSKEEKTSPIVAPIPTKDKKEGGRIAENGPENGRELKKEEKNKGKENVEKGNTEEKNKKEETKNSKNKDVEKNEKNTEEKNKKENKEEKTDEKQIDTEAERGYETAEKFVKSTDHGKKLYEDICKQNPEVKFVFDENSSIGSIKDNVVTVGMKMPSDEKQIAPFNTKKDEIEQSKHVLLHELGHFLLHKNKGNKEMESALSLLKGLYEKEKTTLSPLAQLGVYKDGKSKAHEDLAEMIALYANKESSLDKYLSRLSSDKKEDEEYRKKFSINKFSEKDKKIIKDAITKLVKNI